MFIGNQKAAEAKAEICQRRALVEELALQDSNMSKVLHPGGSLGFVVAMAQLWIHQSTNQVAVVEGNNEKGHVGKKSIIETKQSMLFLEVPLLVRLNCKSF